MKFARRSVSDADIRKYQAFAQTLQQVGPAASLLNCQLVWFPVHAIGGLVAGHVPKCTDQLPTPLPPPQSRGFGSEFRFPDQAGGGAAPAAAGAAPAAAAGTFASAVAADDDDDLYS
jgi:transitional endoplasmic reticulum ATPase